MEKTRHFNLPLAGMIQHGIRTEKGFPKELGYFIARTKDAQMKSLVEKFNTVYNNSTQLKVRFFNEDPFTVRNARYNQSGLVCYCMQGESIGKQKVKNLWQEKECLSNCEYATVKEDEKKPACMEEGTLKFLLPEISSDRVWIMKTRGFTVIDKISSYISSQKIMGNSMIGDFNLYLKQEEHIRQSDGQKFTNYTIDILKIEDDTKKVLQEKESEESQNSIQEIKSTKKNNSINKKKADDNNTSKKESDKVVNINTKSNINFETVKEGEYDVNECLCYIGLEENIIVNKGKEINYTSGKFIDSNNKEIVAIVNKDLAEELKNCDLGTVVLLKIENKVNHNWVTDFKYVQKMLKEAV